MDKFREKLPTMCQVIRNCTLKQVEVKNLVPGDIVEIVEGSIIPADIRIISSHDMKIDNSIFTGSSDLV